VVPTKLTYNVLERVVGGQRMIGELGRWDDITRLTSEDISS
jgi:hypothetical protein